MKMHRQQARAWRMVGAATAFSVAAALAGCGAMQQTVGGWFGAATPTPAPQATAGAAAPRVYYSGIEGLTVYSEPSASSKVIGQLSLHEKVTRYKLERGYAYVESSESGMKGWAKNAQLIWRPPSAPTIAAPAPAEAQPEETQEPEVPEATATAAAPVPTATAAPIAPTRSEATPGGIAPSIFNPY